MAINEIYDEFVVFPAIFLLCFDTILIYSRMCTNESAKLSTIS